MGNPGIHAIGSWCVPGVCLARSSCLFWIVSLCCRSHSVNHFALLSSVGKPPSKRLRWRAPLAPSQGMAPWRRVVGPVSFNGHPVPAYAILGYITEVVRANHVHCGCLRSRPITIFLPHNPWEHGPAPWPAATGQVTLSPGVPPNYVQIAAVSYGYLHAGSLGPWL
jgi:hypothetical protein